MKLEKTKISSYLNSAISVLSREEAFFQAPFHSHPELELVYVKESFGKRIIGNSVSNFEAGDMVFLGSDIPHVWLNDEIYYHNINKLKAQAIVVYFNKDIFGPAFYELKEAKKINSLFEKAKKGLCAVPREGGAVDARLRRRPAQGREQGAAEPAARAAPDRPERRAGRASAAEAIRLGDAEVPDPAAARQRCSGRRIRRRMRRVSDT